MEEKGIVKESLVEEALVRNRGTLFHKKPNQLLLSIFCFNFHSEICPKFFKLIWENSVIYYAKIRG